jgi:hypothetical protein
MIATTTICLAVNALPLKWKVIAVIRISASSSWDRAQEGIDIYAGSPSEECPAFILSGPLLHPDIMHTKKIGN